MLIFLFISMAMAKESWFCTDQTAEVKGTSAYVCGIGESNLESEARILATANARLEFRNLCSGSSECQKYTHTIEPKRSTCDEQNGVWKCYQLLVYNQGESKKEKMVASYNPYSAWLAPKTEK